MKLKELLARGKSFKLPKWWAPSVYVLGGMLLISWFMFDRLNIREPILALIFAVGLIGWGIKGMITTALLVKHILKRQSY